MRAVAAMVLVALTGACASNPPEGTIAVAVVDDFVASAALEQTDRIERITPLNTWVALNDRYVVLQDHNGDHLLHFKSRCYEATQPRFGFEMRISRKRLQIPYDDLMGCQIKTIYRLLDGQAQELRNLGDIPPNSETQ